MQDESGRMRMLKTEEIDAIERGFCNVGEDMQKFQSEYKPLKTIQEGMCFKIKHCYFRISNIYPAGIEAKGISRKEYYDSKR